MRRRWGGLYLALAVGAACVAMGTPTSELCGHSPRPDAADTARGLDLGGSRRIAMGGGLPAQSARGALGNMVGKAWGSIDRVHGCIGGMHEDECEAGATMDPLRLRGGAKQPKSKKRSNSRTRSGSAKGRVEEKAKAKKKKKKMPAHNLPSEGWKDKVINPESQRKAHSTKGAAKGRKKLSYHFWTKSKIKTYISKTREYRAKVKIQKDKLPIRNYNKGQRKYVWKWLPSIEEQKILDEEEAERAAEEAKNKKSKKKENAEGEEGEEGEEGMEDEGGDGGDDDEEEAGGGGGGGGDDEEEEFMFPGMSSDA